MSTLQLVFDRALGLSKEDISSNQFEKLLDACKVVEGKTPGNGWRLRLNGRPCILGQLKFLAQAQPTFQLPTPTPDPSTKEKLDLEKEKLRLENEKLRIDNQNSERQLNTRRGWLNLLFNNLAIFSTIVVGAWGLYRYFERRRAELRSREEERFETVVKSLGSEHREERVSASVLLPTFLDRQYERFHEQVFNLAAGHLRSETQQRQVTNTVTKVEIPGVAGKLELSINPVPMAESMNQSASGERPSMTTRSVPVLQPPPLSPSPLAQGLAYVFSKSFRLARDAHAANANGDLSVLTSQFLNATGVRLDGTYLANIDLRNAWLRESSFRGTTLTGALLTKAVLEDSDFSSAVLRAAELVGANLKNANFSNADLSSAGLDGANLDGAVFPKWSIEEDYDDWGFLRWNRRSRC